MALNVVSKNNTRLKFLHRKKQIFVTSIKAITMQCAYTISFRLCMLSLVHQHQQKIQN